MARLPDGRTIEEAYQLDVKGYRLYGDDWRLGKGKPPLDPSIDLYDEYKKLWSIWMSFNVELFFELGDLALAKDGVLSDRFALTPVTQARALSELLNENYRL